MRPLPILAVAGVLLAPALAARAEPPRAGEVYEITLTRDTASQRSGGVGEGSSHDRDTLVERVIAVRPEGLELEYDLPKQVPAESRARTWQLPARVLKSANGPLQLLNAPELEHRLDALLKQAQVSRAACGHWVFTWTAERIECDPQSVIGWIGAYDLRPAELRDGASYAQPGTLAPAPLVRKPAARSGATFTAELQIDPDAVRRESAEADVAIGEMMRQPVTLDSALRKRMQERVSGTITVTFETDASGDVRRRTSVTRLKIESPDSGTETRTTTETVERRRVERGVAGRG